MTRAEMLLASRLMHQAADEFNNHGCNDTDAELFEGIAVSERAVLAKDFSDWSGEQEDERPLQNIGDSEWMDYLADRLEEGAKSK